MGGAKGVGISSSEVGGYSLWRSVEYGTCSPASFTWLGSCCQGSTGPPRPSHTSAMMDTGLLLSGLLWLTARAGRY